MTRIQKLRIEIPIQDVFRAQGGKKQVSPALLLETEECIDLAYELIQPKILYDFVDIRIDPEGGVEIQLPGATNFTRLKIGGHLDLFNPARKALVAIHSIGSQLEERVWSLNRASDYLRGYLLDCVGLVALRQAGKQVKRMAEERAAQMDWGVSPSLSPGSLKDWKLEDQKTLCSVLDIESGGIRLSEVFVLSPHKSVSSFIGLGPGYTQKKVGSICHLCSLQDTCWQRKS